MIASSKILTDTHFPNILAKFIIPLSFILFVLGKRVDFIEEQKEYFTWEIHILVLSIESVSQYMGGQCLIHLFDPV